MSARGAAIVEVIRSAITSLEQLDPQERDAIVATLVSDLRARHPQTISVLTLGPPTDPGAIRDPRDPRA